MKKIITALSSVALLAAITVPASAQANPVVGSPLFEWNFDEPEGTQLSDVGNGEFNFDIDNSATSGNGSFLLNRVDAANQISYVDLSGAPSTGKLWVTVDILQWDLGDASGFSRLTAGFYDQDGPSDDTNTGVLTSRVDFRPKNDDGVGGFATGDGNSLGFPGSGTWGETSTEGNSPVRLVLEYDQDNNEYEVFFSIAENGSFDNFTSIGSDVTDPSWGANYFALGTVNAWDENTLGMEIDQLTVVPEPSTYAAIFGGVALLGAFLWRRRRS